MDTEDIIDNPPEILDYKRVEIDGSIYYQKVNTYYRLEKKPSITNKAKGSQMELVYAFRKTPLYKKKKPLRDMKKEITKHLSSRHLSWEDEPIYKKIMELLGMRTDGEGAPLTDIQTN